ncbi:DUF1275 family protein [Croceicoccus sp. BE223]|uniref:YoaK family protein n=1 Tax=Croceicoccus sp. BE223 TaxID=2817716 RepID=UPI002857A3FD|nr:DUF1275 family protein [Croceicoccus sp. BE223]MDR7101382.1 uncharacterized membrane protein YoaK (UPF0700 family) [Croceicoccus sp. BE223]
MRDHHIGVLAVVLAGLAGFVDAVGFLASGGYFVSFMSGNSTRLGVGLGEALAGGSSATPALLALALIAAFVSGTVVASLLRRRVGEASKESAVLGFVAGLMALSALLDGPGGGASPLLPLAAAMGAMNLAFEVGGDVRVGLTYMTGTLVKLGLRLADMLAGGARMAWLPYLVLWLGLVCGGVIGAALQMRIGGGATWLAAGLAALVAIVVGLGRRRRAG